MANYLSSVVAGFVEALHKLSLVDENGLSDKPEAFKRIMKSMPPEVLVASMDTAGSFARLKAVLNGMVHSRIGEDSTQVEYRNLLTARATNKNTSNLDTVARTGVKAKPLLFLVALDIAGWLVDSVGPPLAANESYTGRGWEICDDDEKVGAWSKQARTCDLEAWRKREDAATEVLNKQIANFQQKFRSRGPANETETDKTKRWMEMLAEEYLSLLGAKKIANYISFAVGEGGGGVGDLGGQAGGAGAEAAGGVDAVANPALSELDLAKLGIPAGYVELFASMATSTPLTPAQLFPSQASQSAFISLGLWDGVDLPRASAMKNESLILVQAKNGGCYKDWASCLDASLFPLYSKASSAYLARLNPKKTRTALTQKTRDKYAPGAGQLIAFGALVMQVRYSGMGNVNVGGSGERGTGSAWGVWCELLIDRSVE